MNHPAIEMTTIQTTLLRMLQHLEADAGEIADALDAAGCRAIRVPGGKAAARLCTELVAGAANAIRMLNALLDPGEGETGSRAHARPGSVGELRAVLVEAFPYTLEWLVCAAGVDPTSPLPEEARRVACYAAPGANEGHMVHVDFIFASPDGPATVRQVLIGKTELGLGPALAVAALSASIIYSSEAADTEHESAA